MTLRSLLNALLTPLLQALHVEKKNNDSRVWVGC